jgi:N-methylhydantoinase A/oxoprolinase/acetone carboxylase beta subunit
MNSFRIGVDVGGTNTDTVLMDGNEVVASTKASTSSDIASGIVASITNLLRQADVRPEAVRAVMIGTTQFTNALVQRRGLAKVAAIRVCLPSGTSIPIGASWPDDIVQAVSLQSYMVSGGYNFNGHEIAAVSEDEVTRVANEIKASEARAVAINCIFATVRDGHEGRVAEIVRQVIPDAYISLGHRVGRIGLIERENAAIINASLMAFARRTIDAFGDALAQVRINAPVFISQNDGTVMGREFAIEYPVRTLSSGPTNSMRGAAFLSGLADALVVDVGGTTSDAGALVKGFPREAASEFEIEGVRTNFRMPDVLSIGVGGGSRVVFDDHGVKVGPTSVAHELHTAARIFGGTVLTTSDIGVAAGMASFGDPQLVADVPADQVESAIAAWHRQIDDLLAMARGSAEPTPLILVGGGAFLVDPSRLSGISEVVTPTHSGVANAVGAAIPQASGEIDRVVSPPAGERMAAIAELRDEARRQAVLAGAQEATVKIVEEETTQLTQLGDASLRVRIRAVGDIATEDYAELALPAQHA